MNQSVTYEAAVTIASNPQSYDHAGMLFSEVGSVIAFVMFVPLIAFLAVTGIWSLLEDHKYKKLWNNKDFWLALLVLGMLDVALLILSPYLFIWLV